MDKKEKHGEAEKEEQSCECENPGSCGQESAKSTEKEHSRHESHHKRSAEDYKQKYDEMFDQLLRLRAEYANYMKRTQKEKENAYADAKCDAIKAILPVFDNFERALKSESAHKSHSGFKDGMEKIYKQFLETMEKESVLCIPSVGEIFDPELHFAVAHEDDPEKSDGEIIEEYQKGYRYKDRIIRHSMVKTVN